MIERIKRHEGLRFTPYEDSRGNLTLGYGHKLTTPIGRHAALEILREDVTNAWLQFFRLPAEAIDRLTIKRKEVLVEMTFNLGLNGVRKFRRMLKAMEQSNYDGAADEMLDSQWAKQVKSRAIELADMMREG